MDYKWDSHIQIEVKCAQDFQDPSRYRQELLKATEKSKCGVLVQILPTEYLSKLNAIKEFDQVHRFLSYIYVTITSAAAKAGNPLLPIDVVIESLRQRAGVPNLDFPTCDHNKVLSDTRRYLQEHGVQRPTVTRTNGQAGQNHGEKYCDSDDKSNWKSYCYPCIAMGGTFDHLHPGHKILLTVAAWITKTRLIVGISDEPLLKNKKFPELLESLEFRTKAVENFLLLIAPYLEPYLPPLRDVFGPTATEPDIQALVLTIESKAGGDAISKERQKNNLNQLDEYTIDVITAERTMSATESAEDLKSLKLSSTAIRQMIHDNN